MNSDDDSFLSANEDNILTDNDSFTSLTDSLGDYVRKTSQQYQSHFNVCHINAQSVPSHYSELYEVFTSTNVHAILISETWLKPSLLSTTYPLQGFTLIRNDRIDKRGGGVAIYLRSYLSYKVLAVSSSVAASPEFIFLEVCLKGAKCVLGVIYCPPSIDYFSSLESILESLGSEYTHHIIMGDFNTNLLNPKSTRSSKLRQIIESADLYILPLQATHHNIHDEDTWLDIILTSSPFLASFYG